MRICIEESTYEGTPIEILTQLRALHFDAGTFDGTEGYIRYMQNTIRRMTEQPCELPESSTEERAAALIHVLQEIGALELLEEFFLTFNRDSDLYPGMQQGDNGQSLVLGGKNPDGTDSYNLLSELCLKASLELRLIDPKINLRVCRETPLEIYEMGTRLTKTSSHK